MHPLCKSCTYDRLSCPTLLTARVCREWIPRNGPGDWATNILQDADHENAIWAIAMDIWGEANKAITDDVSIARNIVFTACDYLVAAMLMDPRFMKLLKNKIVERVDEIREDCATNDGNEVAREIVELLVTYLQGDVPTGDFSARR